MALLPLVSMLSCAGDDGTLASWWGPVENADGENSYDLGGDWKIRGFAHAIAAPERDLTEIVFAGAATPPSCASYGHWLQESSAVQRYTSEWLETPPDARPAKEDLIHYVCQRLGSAAEVAFGSDGAYRAVHLLVDASGGQPDGDVFAPAAPTLSSSEFVGAEALGPSTYVGRYYERQLHGKDILPCEVADSACWAGDVDPIKACPVVLNQLLLEQESGRETYPDRASIGFQAAHHRYYHVARSQDAITLGSEGELPIGITLANAVATATAGGSARLTGFFSVTRVEEAFAYDEILISSRSQPLTVESCPELDGSDALIWPELGAAPAGDDDSAR